MYDSSSGWTIRRQDGLLEFPCTTRRQDGRFVVRMDSWSFHVRLVVRMDDSSSGWTPGVSMYDSSSGWTPGSVLGKNVCNRTHFSTIFRTIVQRSRTVVRMSEQRFAMHNRRHASRRGNSCPTSGIVHEQSANCPTSGIAHEQSANPFSLPQQRERQRSCPVARTENPYDQTHQLVEDHHGVLLRRRRRGWEDVYSNYVLFILLAGADSFSSDGVNSHTRDVKSQPSSTEM